MSGAQERSAPPRGARKRPVAARPRPATVFLLSPARTDGVRGRQLVARLGAGGATTLGDAFTSISQLYFRGKLTYA